MFNIEKVYLFNFMSQLIYINKISGTTCFLQDNWIIHISCNVCPKQYRLHIGDSPMRISYHYCRIKTKFINGPTGIHFNETGHKYFFLYNILYPNKKKFVLAFVTYSLKLKKQHGWILRGTDKDERYEQKYINFCCRWLKKNSKLLFIHSASYIQILFIGSNFTIILALLQIRISDMTVLKKEIWPPPTPFNFSILWINHFKYRST